MFKKATYELIRDQIRLIQNRFIVKSPIIKHFSYTKYEKALIEFKKSRRKLPIRFVIFNYPRTGSNMLCSMLNSHPHIICHHELFNPKRIYYSKNFDRLMYGEQNNTLRKDLCRGKIGINTIAERNHSPEKFMFKIWQYNYGFDAVGFNLFPSHIPNATDSIIRDNKIKKILLLRRNKVKTYVSRLIAKSTGVWALYNNHEQRKINHDIKVVVNPKRLQNWSQKYDRYFNSIKLNLIKSNQPFMEIFYEDLVSKDSNLVKNNLLEFIGVQKEIEYLQATLRKQNSKSLKEQVENFEQLQQHLKGTKLELMLQDGIEF